MGKRKKAKKPRPEKPAITNEVLLRAHYDAEEGETEDGLATRWRRPARDGKNWFSCESHDPDHD